MRALEVIRSTGQSLGFWQSKPVGGIRSDVNAIGTILLPPRDWLRSRCDARFDWMVENGGIAEVSALLARRLDVNLPVMRAIGIPEIAAFLHDHTRRAECVERAKAATRQYAKRQYTWFRNQSPVDWQRIDAQLNPELINNLVIKLRERALTS
jgi:tRNA dimethylallyltransferase